MTAVLQEQIPTLVPVLSCDCRLYFDGQHDRWVLKAPHQVTFPDRFTRTVLQACDGSCKTAQIARSLASLPELKNITETKVFDLLSELEQRGFIHFTTTT